MLEAAASNTSSVNVYEVATLDVALECTERQPLVSGFVACALAVARDIASYKQAAHSIHH